MDNKRLHIDDDDVLQFIFGELDNRREAELRKGIAADPDLAHSVRYGRRIVSALRADNSGHVSDDFETRLWLRMLALDMVKTRPDGTRNGDDLATACRPSSAEKRRAGHPLSIVVGGGSPSRTSPSMAAYLFRTGPISYATSALIMCVALLAAWQCRIANRLEHLEMVCDPSYVGVSSHAGNVFVGHVSGIEDCQWNKCDEGKKSEQAAQNPKLPIFSPVAFGRHIELDSGLLEITFRSGAKVILEGPVAFDVEENGGFLRAGRLAGILERPSGAATKSAAGNSAAFCIRTPSAIVNDVGTEFGVEVDKNGRTTSHVFRGAVIIRSVGSHGDTILLKRGDSAQTTMKEHNRPFIERIATDPDRFVRRLGQVQGPVFGTGWKATTGNGDPQWQGVAASNDPEFRPRPATVINATQQTWNVHSCSHAKWIAPSYCWLQPVPEGTVYTFRTTFVLEEGQPESTVLHGRAYVVGKMIELRLNGQRVMTPDSGPKSMRSGTEASTLHRVSLDDGFVVGTNVLEIEVATSDQAVELPDPYSRLGLCVAWDKWTKREP